MSVSVSSMYTTQFFRWRWPRSLVVDSDSTRLTNAIVRLSFRTWHEISGGHCRSLVSRASFIARGLSEIGLFAVPVWFLYTCAVLECGLKLRSRECGGQWESSKGVACVRGNLVKNVLADSLPKKQRAYLLNSVKSSG